MNAPVRPDTAMVLAAGLGTRMDHLTKDRPKPLVEVAGTPLLEFCLNQIENAGLSKAVINVHYKADLIRVFLIDRDADKASRLDIIVSDECEQLLDTGGGVRKALPLLGAEPFYVVNSDVMWRDGVRNSFDLLADRCCADTMDALLLLAPATMAVGYHGQGDFLMEPDGLLARRREREQAPFIFSGVQILHPRLLVDCPNGPFSLNLVWSRAIERGRLYGVRREGVWFHVGSPDAVKAAELWLPG
ncbi:MAG TPA: nucleotidyltransferase family protein [Sneathiellales bacterium]|nr:nucleotidyltransferase family protein [Sneathiellales bacterium]